jgi:hypothetical protein
MNERRQADFYTTKDTKITKKRSLDDVSRKADVRSTACQHARW